LLRNKKYKNFINFLLLFELLSINAIVLIIERKEDKKMAEDKKNTFGDVLKKAFDPKKEVVKPVAKASVGAKPTGPKVSVGAKPTGPKSETSIYMNTQQVNQAKLNELKAGKEKQLAALHAKTHQDLINAAYKAAEELKISPFVLLKDEWSNFTNTRGNKYTGPAIDDLKHLDIAQKAALKKALGL